MKMSNIILTDTKIIKMEDGDILHAIKSTDETFRKFGEAYFSTIKPGRIKAWKMHKIMTLNIVVPIGEIKFVLFEENNALSSDIVFHEYTLSRANYKRLTVPPRIWMGFKCLSNGNALLLNVADIEHDPKEVENKRIDEVDYEWR